MKRNHLTPKPVNLEAPAPVQARRPVAKNKDRSWFKIENKKNDEADVYIYDEIGFWGTTAADFASQLRDLDVGHITLHLNSPGGDVFDGVAIYNTLVNHKADISVFVDGLAASAASFIAQAGDEVVMGKGSTMMIHDASGMAWGNAEEMRQTADILDRVSDTIAGFYADRTGGTVDEWRGLMQAETWYNADEAVEAGLADRVNKASKDDEDDPENNWDLSVFNYAGRDASPSPRMTRTKVLNRLKENTVATKNEAEGGEVTPEPTVTPAAPEAPKITTEDVQNDETVGDTIGTIEALPENKGTVNSAAGTTKTVVINGVKHDVSPEVYAHLSTLEQFQTDQRVSSRNEFVDTLASDGKVTGPMATEMKALVQTFTDEQYTAYQKVWDAAPQMSLFGTHGNQPNSPESQAQAVAVDRTSVLKEVVATHVRGGAPLAKVQQKDSYIELSKLMTENELNEFVDSVKR